MQSTILDDFADLSGWMAVASGLAELRISPDGGPAGAVMRRVESSCVTTLRFADVSWRSCEIPRSRRWRVSRNGRRVMAAAVKLREVAYPSLYAEALATNWWMCSIRING